jgi:hypothetical protein
MALRRVPIHYRMNYRTKLPDNMQLILSPSLTAVK